MSKIFEVIMVRRLKNGIKIMTRSKGFTGGHSYVFARSSTLRGYITLRLRGYKPHKMILRTVLRKDVKCQKVEESGAKWLKGYL